MQTTIPPLPSRQLSGFLDSTSHHPTNPKKLTLKPERSYDPTAPRALKHEVIKNLAEHAASMIPSYEEILNKLSQFGKTIDVLFAESAEESRPSLDTLRTKISECETKISKQISNLTKQIKEKQTHTEIRDAAWKLLFSYTQTTGDYPTNMECINLNAYKSACQCVPPNNNEIEKLFLQATKEIRFDTELQSIYDTAIMLAKTLDQEMGHVHKSQGCKDCVNHSGFPTIYHNGSQFTESHSGSALAFSHQQRFKLQYDPVRIADKFFQHLHQSKKDYQANMHRSNDGSQINKNFPCINIQIIRLNYPSESTTQQTSTDRYKHDEVYLSITMNHTKGSTNIWPVDNKARSLYEHDIIQLIKNFSSLLGKKLNAKGTLKGIVINSDLKSLNMVIGEEYRHEGRIKNYYTKLHTGEQQTHAEMIAFCDSQIIKQIIRENAEYYGAIGNKRGSEPRDRRTDRYDDRDRGRSRDRYDDRDRGRIRDQHHDRDRGRSRDQHHDRDRGRIRDRYDDRDCGRSRDQHHDRDRGRSRDRYDDRDRGRIRDQHHDKRHLGLFSSPDETLRYANHY